MKNKAEELSEITRKPHKECAWALHVCYGYMDLAERWLKASSIEDIDQIELEAEDRELQQDEFDAILLD